MRLCSIASGSSGNCIYVGDENTHILVDAGISKKRIEIKKLKSVGLDSKFVSMHILERDTGTDDVTSSIVIKLKNKEIEIIFDTNFDFKINADYRS